MLVYRWVWLLTLCLSADYLFAHQDYSMQIEQLSEDIAKNPNDATLYQRRGELLGLCGSLGLAQADFAQCRAINPEMIETHFLEGRMFLDAGKPDEALRLLEKFLSLRPSDPGAELLAARANMQLGRRAAAERFFARALQSLPAPEPDNYIEWANFVADDPRSERRPDSIAILDEGISRLGPIVTLHLVAIELEISLRRFESAIARVDAIMAQAGRKDAWLTQKGEILLISGSVNEARDAFTQALSEIESLPVNRRRSQMVADREAHLRRMLDSNFELISYTSDWSKYQ